MAAQRAELERQRQAAELAAEKAEAARRRLEAKTQENKLAALERKREVADFKAQRRAELSSLGKAEKRRRRAALLVPLEITLPTAFLTGIALAVLPGGLFSALLMVVFALLIWQVVRLVRSPDSAGLLSAIGAFLVPLAAIVGFLAMMLMGYAIAGGLAR